MVGTHLEQGWNRVGTGLEQGWNRVGTDKPVPTLFQPCLNTVPTVNKTRLWDL